MLIKRAVLTLLLLLIPLSVHGIETSGANWSGVGVSSGGATYTKYITDNTTDFNSITYASGDCITGVEDSGMKSGGDSANNYSSATTYEISKYSASGHSHLPIKFPTSSIPSTATVTSVTLGIYSSSTSAGSRTLEIHGILRTWVNAQVTWDSYSTGNSWTTGGALGSGTDIASTATTTGVTMPSGGSWLTHTATSGDILDDVQDWIDGTTTNNGWHMQRDDGADDSQYNIFVSTEGTDGSRPYLKVVYTN